MCRDNLHSFREALEDTKKFSFFIQELFDFFWIMVMGGGHVRSGCYVVLSFIKASLKQNFF